MERKKTQIEIWNIDESIVGHGLDLESAFRAYLNNAGHHFHTANKHRPPMRMKRDSIGEYLPGYSDDPNLEED